MASAFLIVVGLIFLYIVIIIILRRLSLFEKLNLSLFGPILLVRTQRGKRLIKKLAHLRRFWTWYGNVGLVITYISMLMMFLILIMSAIGSTMKQVQPVPASDILVIPGVNKLIPLYYGIIALIIGIIVHEFSHGILAFVGNLKVKSLGILMLVIPIGAFVEPDDKELKAAPRLKRMRVYAAGPTMNIVVGLLCALIFSWGMMGAVTPKYEGVMVFSISKDYPAEEAGIEPGMIVSNMTLYHILPENGTQASGNDTVYFGNVTYAELDPGLVRSNHIMNDSYSWLLAEGMNYTVEHFVIEDHISFSDALALSAPGDKLDIHGLLKGDVRSHTNITLADKYDYIETEENRGKGFLGVHAQDPDTFIEILNHPVSSADSFSGAMLNLFMYSVMLPMNPDIMPLHAPITDMYEINGFWSVLGDDGFWFLANTLYYVFWLNILIGTFNTLPSIPVDGGFIFKDTLGAIMDRLNIMKNEKKRERIAKAVSVFSALLVASLIIFIILFPRLRALLS